MKNLLYYLNDNDKSVSDRIDYFYEFIEKKINKGYDRYNIYLLIENIINNYYYDLPESITDAIYEFKTSLIGDAAPASIIRFKGDPRDDEDLAKYVRSNIWKKNGNVSN